MVRALRDMLTVSITISQTVKSSFHRLQKEYVNLITAQSAAGCARYFVIWISETYNHHNRKTMDTRLAYVTERQKVDIALIQVWMQCGQWFLTLAEHHTSSKLPIWKYVQSFMYSKNQIHSISAEMSELLFGELTS